MNFGDITWTGTSTYEGCSGMVAYGHGMIYNCINYGDLHSTPKGTNWGYAGLGEMTGCLFKQSDMFSIVALGNGYMNAGNKGDIVGLISAKLRVYNSFYDGDKIYGGKNHTDVIINAKKIDNNYQEVVNELNQVIENGYVIEEESKEQIDVDTTNWAKWVLRADGLPTLDLNETWDGTKWVKK